MDDQLFKATLALGGIIAMLYAISYLIKRLNLFSDAPTRLQKRLKGGVESQIVIHESKRLNPQSHIYLVEVSGQSHMIVTTPQGLQIQPLQKIDKITRAA